MPANPVAAVLFDLGGVLVRLDHAAIAARLAEAGIVCEPRTLAQGEAAARRAIDARAAAHGTVVGTDATRVPDYFEDVLAGAGIDAARRPALVARLREDHRVRNLWRVPVEGGRETLAALREAGVRTGVVSNSDGRVESVLAEAGLAGGFDAVLDSHHEGVEKPHPEIFRRALGRLGARAEHTLFVGDIWSIDVVGARGAGLRAVLLDAVGGYPDAACERVARLPELLALPGLETAGGGEGA